MSLSKVALNAVDPTPDEVQYLEDRIYEFNSSATGIVGGEWLSFSVKRTVSWRGSAGTRGAAPVSCASSGWSNLDAAADSVGGGFRPPSRRHDGVAARKSC